LQENKFPLGRGVGGMFWKLLTSPCPLQRGTNDETPSKGDYDKIHKISNSLITLFVLEITTGPYRESEKTI
jgi:hypothetical protein